MWLMRGRVSLLAALALSPFAAKAQPYEFLFSNTDSSVTYLRVVSDGVRNTYAAGIQGGQLFVQKLDATGLPVWSTVLPDTPNTKVTRILLDANQDIYVGSVFGTTDKFAMVTSLRRTDGSIRWINNFDCGDKNDAICDLAVAKVGNSVLLYQLTNARISSTNNDVVARRLNPATGLEVWKKQIGGSVNDFPVQIVANAAGAPFIATTLDATKPTVLRLSGTDGSIVFSRTQTTLTNFNGFDRGLTILSDGRIGHVFDGGDNLGNAVGGMEILEATNGALAKGYVFGSNATAGTQLWTGLAATRHASMVSWFNEGQGFELNESSILETKKALGSADTGSTVAVDLGDQIQAATAGVAPRLLRAPSTAEFALNSTATEIDVDNKNQITLALNHSIVKLRQRPVAADDTFSRPIVNGTISVPAPGILKNDGGVFGATIDLFQIPAKGTVVLDPSGSFVYTPGQAFAGVDNFKYRVTVDGQASTATVNVRQLKLNDHTLPVDAFGGDNVQGLLTFNFPPDGDLPLEVSDNSSAVTSPATAPLGVSLSLNRTYTLKTLPVSAQFNVSITAKIQTITNTRSIAIKPGGLKELVAFKTSLVSGEPNLGVVRLTGPRNVTVGLSSSDPAVTVPNSVAISGTEAAFLIDTQRLTAPKSVTITAKLGLTTKSLVLELAAMPKIVSMDGFGHVVGGAPYTGGVNLDKATPYDLDVDLSVTPTTAGMTVPATVTVKKGQTFRSFDAPTVAVTADKTVTLKASVGGAAVTKTVKIIRNPLDQVIVSPTSVIGGTSAQGTAKLNNLAPPDGIRVALFVNSVDVDIPQSVLISAGSWSANFAIVTKPVAANTTRTITAKVALVTKTVTFFVVR